MNTYKQIYKNLNKPLFIIYNDNRYDSELLYQRPDLLELMEVEMDLIYIIKIDTRYKCVTDMMKYWWNDVKLILFIVKAIVALSLMVVTNIWKIYYLF